MNYYFIFLSNGDSGIYNAMNKGLLHAKGDIVLFLNAGDRLYDKNSIARACQYFETEPDTDILIGRELIEGKVCRTHLDRMDKSVYYGSFFPHQATFSKTDLYNEYRLFDEQYAICADYDWVLGAYHSGYKLRWSEDVVSIYDSGGISSSYESIAEQYLISSKYLNPSDNTGLLYDCKKHYIEVFERTFFRNIIKGKEENTLIKECLYKLIKGRTVDVWGAGYIGRMVSRFLSSNGANVRCILDSNPSIHGTMIDGIPVCEFKDVSGSLIVISTTDYEREIEYQLRKLGLTDMEDFLTFTDISAYVTSFLLNGGYDDGGFRLRTGLNL